MSDAMTSAAIKPGWKTTEFWLSLVAKILGGLFAAGVIGDGTPIYRIAGLAAVVLTAMGYTVNRSILKAAASAVLFLTIAHTSTACSWLSSEGKSLGKNVVDCTTSTAKSHIDQYEGVVENLIVSTLDSSGHPDMNQIKSATKNFGLETGGCVLTAAVQHLLNQGAGSGASPVAIDRVTLQSGYLQLVAVQYGDRSFYLGAP